MFASAASRAAVLCNRSADKLKTHVTSSGFFEHAVAAPSMKAALESWGAKTNLFHKGFAKETSDPNIVAAAMADVLPVFSSSVDVSFPAES
jgi:hypothetical protein